jgi:hypothetical protein
MKSKQLNIPFENIPPNVAIDADFILDLYESTKEMKPEEQPKSIEFLKDLTSYIGKNYPLQ